MFKRKQKKRVIAKSQTIQKRVLSNLEQNRNTTTIKEEMQSGYIPINLRYPSSKSNYYMAEGTTWCTTKDLKDSGFLEDDESKIFIDSMSMYKEYAKIENNIKSPFGELLIPKGGPEKGKLLSVNLNKNVYFEKLNFTRTILALGGVGSGKTEWAKKILSEQFLTEKKLYNRTLYHDLKGDFVADFYREGKDIIFNLFDERGTDWNFFKDMEIKPSLARSFSKGLILASSGEDGDDDQWVGFATNVLLTGLKKAFKATKDNKERWLYLMAHLEEYKALAEEDGKTKTSIWMSLETAYEILQIMTYRIAVLNKPTFSIHEYFKKTDIQLFLLNNDAYEEELSPLFSSFTTTFISIGMSRADTKTDLSLNMLDEFLSLKLSNKSQKSLFTASRSKGFMNVIMAQYLNKSDEELLQLMENSRYALLLFSIQDTFTLETMSKNFDKVKYIQRMMTTSKGENIANSNNNTDEEKVVNNTASITRNIQESKQETNVLSVSDIQGIPPFHHITFIPKERLLYLGYTPPSELESINNLTFDEMDQNKMIDWLFNNTFIKLLEENTGENYTGNKEEIKKIKNTKLPTENDYLKLQGYLVNNEYNDAKDIIKSFKPFEKFEEELAAAFELYLLDKYDESKNIILNYINRYFKLETSKKETDNILNNLQTKTPTEEQLKKTLRKTLLSLHKRPNFITEDSLKNLKKQLFKIGREDLINLIEKADIYHIPNMANLMKDIEKKLQQGLKNEH